MAHITHEAWVLSCSFLLCLLGMAFNRSHFLSALLCLEGMMLSIFTAATMWAFKSSSLTPMIYPLTLLTLSACEAAIGLALMIATARSHGSDKLKTLNLLRC